MYPLRVSEPKPAYGLFKRKTSKRKNFKMSTKKKEWNKAAGRDEDDFKSTSRCRVSSCKRRLTWGSGAYDFDHKDNNSANNGQKNCWLVCKVCHGKNTKIGKKKVKSVFGQTVGYKTIKKKVGYKKVKKKKTQKKRVKRKATNVFGFSQPKMRW